MNKIIPLKFDSNSIKEDHKNLVSYWKRIKGDSTYRLNYDSLSDEGIVFDVGGYEGKWAKDIFCKYMPYMYIFEPVPYFMEGILETFKYNKKVSPFLFGFDGFNGTADFYVNASSSSALKADGQKIKVKMRKMSDFIIETGLEKIDLVKLNVEGSEYAIIEELYFSGLLPRICSLQIQFHYFVDDSFEKIQKIRSFLSETHTMDWGFDFVWENWSLK